MAAQSSTDHADRVISLLASRQHGVVAREQLLAEGLTRHQITQRLRTGRLHPLHRGIYLAGHEVPPRYAPETAALLLCEGAALRHRTAASLWELLPYPQPGRIRIAIPPGRSAARPGIDAHRTELDPRDVRRRHGLPVTSPPRTILDLAAAVDDYALEKLVADARYRGLASEAELAGQLERHPRRPGSPALCRVLGLAGGAQRTRSVAERRLLRLLREAGETGFDVNARVAGYEVDVLWRELGLAIELDGYDGHSGRVAFERDRLKAATLVAAGIDVMPLTPRQLRDDPHAALARILSALASARKRAGRVRG